jgi:hypothetical protein
MVTGPVPAHSAAVQHSDEKLIAALKERYPGWDIHRVFGGWEAVPAGTAVIRSMDLEGIGEKLGALPSR